MNDALVSQLTRLKYHSLNFVEYVPKLDSLALYHCENSQQVPSKLCNKNTYQHDIFIFSSFKLLCIKDNIIVQACTRCTTLSRTNCMHIVNHIKIVSLAIQVL